MFRLAWSLVAALPLLALPTQLSDCSSGDDTPTPDPMAGEDTQVVVFDDVHQQFGNGDTRTVSADVAFPDAQWHYAQITMHYTLACPEGGCDPWDRLAYVQVVENAGAPDEKVVEVGRFITPYGVGGSWSIDVTDLRPVLSGDRTVRAFIDTWVNPGWLVDVSFDFVGGAPARRAVDVQPLYAGYYTYGDPNNPPDNHLTDRVVDVPADVGGASIRVLATGHGFGATENCAEFCQKEHTLLANGVFDTAIPWRDDCKTAGVPGQSGTFWYSRAGWCPGDDVEPRTWDVSDVVVPGQAATFDYRLQSYTNLETSVSPYWVITAYLVLYE